MLNMLNIEDFAKLDIRIGEIVSVEIVPDTDKLLELKVDFGEEEPRTIVSGISQYYSPEDLTGRQAPFVTNLEPREIKGILSQGMILAVGNSKGITLLNVDSRVENGSKVG
jgi:methionyl-tRNA synthetase